MKKKNYLIIIIITILSIIFCCVASLGTYLFINFLNRQSALYTVENIYLLEESYLDEAILNKSPYLEYRDNNQVIKYGDFIQFDRYHYFKITEGDEIREGYRIYFEYFFELYEVLDSRKFLLEKRTLEFSRDGFDFLSYDFVNLNNDYLPDLKVCMYTGYSINNQCEIWLRDGDKLKYYDGDVNLISPDYDEDLNALITTNITRSVSQDVVVNYYQWLGDELVLVYTYKREHVNGPSDDNGDHYVKVWEYKYSNGEKELFRERTSLWTDELEIEAPRNF